MSVKATITVSIEPSSTACLSSSSANTPESLTPALLTRALAEVENRRANGDGDFDVRRICG
jgi:hypothetical protein